MQTTHGYTNEETWIINLANFHGSRVSDYTDNKDITPEELALLLADHINLLLGDEAGECFAAEYTQEFLAEVNFLELATDLINDSHE